MYRHTVCALFIAQIFRLLRLNFGVAHDAYLDSLGGDFGSMLAKYSQGRSNAFFFYTSDSRWVPPLPPAKFVIELSGKGVFCAILESASFVSSRNETTFACSREVFISASLYIFMW